MAELQCLIGRGIGIGSAKVNHWFAEYGGNLKCALCNGVCMVLFKGKWPKHHIDLNVDKKMV